MSLKALLSEWHTPPPTPTLLGQKSSSNESAELVNQYKRLYHEIQRLITRIRGKKLYSCDTHEVYSCYGFKKNFWIDDLNDDKLLLALNAAALEEVRVDALQWVASFSVGPLPAEIVAPIYEAILASKYQGVEDPWHRVNDQIQFSAMISACGVEHAPDHNATSRGQSPCPSFQPATEISESEPINFAHFEWAQDSEVLRYQDNGEVNLVLDNDITKDLSPELCLAEKVGNADNVSASVTQALKRKRSANTLEETMVSKKSKETSKHSSPTEQSRMFDHDSIIMRSQCNLMSDKD